MTKRESGTSLPLPGGWDAPPLGGWLRSIVAALLGFVMVVPSVTFVGQGRPWAAAVAALTVVVLTVVAVRARPVEPRFEPARLVQVDVDGATAQGLRFPVRAMTSLTGIGLLLAGMAFTGLAIAAAVVTVRRGDWPMLAGFVLLGAVGAVFLLGGVAALRSARSGLSIDLTPRQVVLRLGFDPVVLAWHDIDRVEATTVRYGWGRLIPRPIQHWLVLAAEPRASGPRIHRRGDRATAMPARRILSDPVVLYHALWHYLDHPDERSELGTDVASCRWNSHGR